MRNINALLTYKSGLPFIFGAFCMIISGSYFIAAMVAEATIGRPSSTFAIGYIQAPIAAMALGAVGFAMGSFIAQQIGRYRPQWEHLVNVKSPITLSLFLIISSFGVYLSANVGYANVKDFEERSKPHVIIDKGLLLKVFSLPFNSPRFQDAVKTWDLRKESAGLSYSFISWLVGTNKMIPSIKWNSRQVTVVSDRDIILIRDDAGKNISQTDLSKYDYTRELWAVPVRFQLQEQEYLAVIANLRSTSNRAMVLIYSPEGALVYHEILERKGCETIIKKVTDLKTQQESVEVKTPASFYLIASK